MATTVKSVAFVHTSDIDPTVVKSGVAWEGLVNICVTAAEKALDTPPAGYTAVQRNSLTDVFSSMKATHRAIRLLVKEGDAKPESVDALVLARLQLEGLYTICLLLETTDHVARFVKEAWKRQYIRHLLEREELKNVPRLANSDAADFERLMNLKTIWGVTDAEQRTIEYHELGVQEPVGFIRQPIAPFPTPGMVIKEIPEGTKRRMLERLYVEYQDLCAYAHGRPISGFSKAMFDARSPLRSQVDDSEITKVFGQRVQTGTQFYSLLSVAQSTAELTTLYRSDVDLASASIRAWNELHNSHMLANAVWAIRTKSLLGAVG